MKFRSWWISGVNNNRKDCRTAARQRASEQTGSQLGNNDKNNPAKSFCYSFDNHHHRKRIFGVYFIFLSFSVFLECEQSKNREKNVQ